jgi:hypothetical protein
MRHTEPATPERDTRSTLRFLGAFTVYWVLALALDSAGGGVGVQGMIGAASWVALALALWHAPRELRVPVLAMVVVATACECLGSLVWGAYQYRYHNLPAYVPPGHGLFYLAALRIALLPKVQRHGRALLLTVGLCSAGWAMYGLLARPRVDVVGALCWVILVYFLRRGRDPLLLAVTFSLTMGLEFYGTALGVWHWAPVLPGTSLTAANPPSAIAAGYCGLDLLARRLVRYSGRLRVTAGSAGRHVPRAGPVRRARGTPSTR